MSDSLRFLLFYIKPYRKYLVVSVVSSVVSIICSLMVPVIIGQAIDFIVSKGNVSFDRILFKIIYICVLTGISAIFQWTSAFFINKISYQAVNQMKNDIFSKFTSLPLKFIDRSSHGDLLTRIVSDSESVSDGLIQFITQFLSGIITIFGTLFFMLSINVWISVAVILITPLSLLFALFVAKKSHYLFKEQSAIQGELNGYAEEMIGGQKVIKSFAFENKSKEKFEEINSRLYVYGLKSQFYSAIANPGTRFVNSLVYVAAGITGALISITNGTISIGQISSFLFYSNQYTKPFNEMTAVVSQIQTALASLSRIFSLVSKEDESTDVRNELSVQKFNGAVEFKNISFSYSSEYKFIQDFSLDVKPGQHVAIVGPTGCGKTTLINLLMRFYEIDSGDIKIDNVSIFDVTRKKLRSLFGMVLQETWLFSGTVKENIAYGNPDATDEEIIRAAKLTHAHGFIMRLGNGYQTKVTDDGSVLSQGQKQLLCIARVMLLDPTVLILDEATSNIDTRTEIQVQSAFNNLMEGKTSFIIAHRLSTIKSADVIVVMKDGCIIEKGTHEQLLSLNGFYKNLYNSQFHDIK